MDSSDSVSSRAFHKYSYYYHHYDNDNQKNPYEEYAEYEKEIKNGKELKNQGLHWKTLEKKDNDEKDTYISVDSFKNEEGQEFSPVIKNRIMKKSEFNKMMLDEKNEKMKNKIIDWDKYFKMDMKKQNQMSLNILDKLNSQ